MTRRELMRLATAGAAIFPFLRGTTADGEPVAVSSPPSRPFLTLPKDFRDVSRGNPIPHTLQGEALVQARLTPETWRLEIVAEDKAKIDMPLTMADGTALDWQALNQLGEKHAVRYLKAMQCNNIDEPLGQGLWEGVPLRVVLQRCGKLTNARRLYYWGFHNDKPEQMFKSSLAMNQVLDTPPGELPPLVAYRLNGGPIPLTRGGPVRMIVPWAHGFKSIKWLQRIVLTNSYAANDTYAEQNNDPESYLKTAAYFDGHLPRATVGKPIQLRGTAMVGWPGLERVEYWLRPDTGTRQLAEDDPAWAQAQWRPAVIDPLPTDWAGGLGGLGGLPNGLLPSDVHGFDKAGQPKEWPLRFSIAHWSIVLEGLQAGQYEVRVRTVDKNGFAQPEPRPNPRSGRNLVQCRVLEVT